MTYATHSAPEPAIVQWTKRLEENEALDKPAERMQHLADLLLANPSRARLLHGEWLGHAVHPLLTDLPLGAWTSATILDLLGGRRSRPAARRLVGVGILAAVPTAVTGVAEWGVTEGREKRVGVAHALSNNVALLLYVASWVARRRERHVRGALLGLTAGLAAGVGGYLGGHLTEARKVSSRHPAYEENGFADL